MYIYYVYIYIHIYMYMYIYIYWQSVETEGRSAARDGGARAPSCRDPCHGGRVGPQGFQGCPNTKMYVYMCVCIYKHI